MNHKIFIYPTDTVWGIGASILSQEATRQIAEIKKTPENKPLSVLFSSIEQMREYISFPDSLSSDWLSIFFSLESTLAVSRKLADGRIPAWVLGDSDLVAIRCLPHTGVEDIIRKVGSPITSTSFNLSGTPAISSRDEAYKLYLSIASHHCFIDDPGANLSGNSSTIVRLETDFSFSVMRGGNKVEELLKHVQLLTA